MKFNLNIPKCISARQDSFYGNKTKVDNKNQHNNDYDDHDNHDNNDKDDDDYDNDDHLNQIGLVSVCARFQLSSWSRSC